MRNRNRFVQAALLAGVLVATPAAGQKLKIETHTDPAADFSAIRTYAWLPPAPLVKNAPDELTNPTLSQEVLGPHIVEAVDRQLARRGLTPVDQGAADVLVVYFAAMTVGTHRSYVGEYYGYVTGWPSPIPSALAPSTSVDIYEQGTVVIDMVQRASNRAIWRGSVVTRIHQARKLEERIARINDGTERMFERFPLRPRK
jgi:hypothetical protein